LLGQTAVRNPVATDFDSVVTGFAPVFPSANEVAGTAAAISDTFGFPVVSSVGYARPLSDTLLLDVSPGVVGLRRIRAAFGERDSQWRDDPSVPLSLFTLDGQDVDQLPTGPRSVITEWSKPSRARMYKKIGQLDYSAWSTDEGTLAMVTLTLPGDWLPLVPTGKDFKRLIELMRQRWVRAGLVWRGLWKLEFQERGAPHLHALMRVPAMVGRGDRAMRFEEWIAHTWVDVVSPDTHFCHRCSRYRSGVGSIPLPAGAGVMLRFTDVCVCETPDTERSRMLTAHLPSSKREHGVIDFSGIHFSDPKRTAIYFGKHASKTKDDKEYQHIVPRAWREPGAGPGRFWGVWGLDTAVSTVEVPERQFFRMRRVLRNLTHARSAAQLLLAHEHATLTLEEYREKSSQFRRWVRHDASAVDMGESARRLSLSLPTLRRRRFLTDHRDGGWALVGDGLDVGIAVAASGAGPSCTCLDAPDVGPASEFPGFDARREQVRRRRDLGRVDRSVKVSRLQKYDASAGILRVDLPRGAVCAHCYPCGRSQRLVKP
jgi:hypothetical protein